MISTAAIMISEKRLLTTEVRADHSASVPYLENRMPIIAATDPNSDTGKIAEDNGYGFWCESNSVEAFTAVLDEMIAADRKAMGEKGYEKRRRKKQSEYADGRNRIRT